MIQTYTRKIRDLLIRHKREVFIVLLILLVAGVPRLLDLGTFLTADEKNWIGRSYEFVRAFKDWRFNDMLQTTHPGVTTLWLVGAAVTGKMIVSQVPFSFQNLIQFVGVAQLVVALVNTAAVAGIYILLRQLFKKSLIPLVATLIIALDPFIIGYSRVAHVDAMLAGFLFMAILATLIYVKNSYSRRWLIASAVLSGLAILTKAPAVFMIPWFGLVVLWDNPRIFWHRDMLLKRAREFILWALIVALIFVLVWPAMIWVPNTKGNALVLKRDLVEASVTPHHMAEGYTLNAWHYPATLLARTTPVTLGLGLAVALILLSRVARLGGPPTSARSRGEDIGRGKRRDRTRDIEWLLFAYIFFFIIMMTLGAKKGDRYILPVWPAIDVLAAIGLVWLAGLIGGARKKIWLIGGGILVIGYLGIVVAGLHPYNIAYSNPLFAENLSQELGWGEGLEQVGAWLSKEAPESVVASWYPEELGAFTSAHVAHINAHEQGKVRYVVLYKNMFGRAIDHYANNFIDEYYKKRDPVFVAMVAGQEFAWVYEKPVYERVVGKLAPGFVVEQEVVIKHENLIGFDLLMATYSGQAQAGDLVVRQRLVGDRQVAQIWRRPVVDIEDNSWVTFKLDNMEFESGESIIVEVSAEGTTVDDAPTVRYTRDFDYRSSQVQIDGKIIPGDLAIRLRYLVDGKEVIEDETRLLD